MHSPRSVHIDIAEVLAEHGKPYVFVAIDRALKFVCGAVRVPQRY